MSALAGQLNAINLAQGFPDFPSEPALADRVSYYINAGYNQYAPSLGIPTLRTLIAEKANALYTCGSNADTWVTVTSGACEALFCAILSTVHPGDEVIIFDPAYDSYTTAVALAGGNCRHIALHAPNFRINWDHVAEAINERTRLVIINSPHNPTGSLITQEDLEQLWAVIAEREIYVLSDEVYEHIIFDGHQHASVLAHSQLRERSFVVFSFGKTYHVTGWRIGYCIAPPALTSELRKVHQYNTFSTATPLQYAVADIMREGGAAAWKKLGEFFQDKRDYLRTCLEGTGLALLPCNGTYFQLVDYSAWSQESDVKFAHDLTLRCGVATIPISVFYKNPPQGQHLLRVCFAKQEATLKEAALRLTNIGL
jgi:methionine aminotransferase